MFIQIEETPNPATIKFLPGRLVLGEKTANFASRQEAERAPLAKRLFNVHGIEGVFLGSDFISVTKNPKAEWFALKPLVLESLVQFFTTHAKVEVHDLAAQEASSEEVDEIIKEIQELLTTRIQPAVAMDGGNIIFDRFEDGVVYLQLQGACSGCPSSTATLKTGIENMLRYYIPEVKEVRATNEAA